MRRVSCRLCELFAAWRMAMFWDFDAAWQALDPLLRMFHSDGSTKYLECQTSWEVITLGVAVLCSVAALSKCVVGCGLK